MTERKHASLSVISLLFLNKLLNFIANYRFYVDLYKCDVI